MGKENVKQMPLWQALTLFGTPGLAILLLTYAAVPQWVESGMPLIWSWTLAILLPLLLTNLLVVGGYLWRRHPSLSALRTRFRLTAPSTEDWKWIGIGFVTTIVLSFAFEWTQPYMRELAPMQPIVPELFVDPYATAANRGGTATFFGVPMAGEYWLIPFWLVWLAVMVPLEELLWRGYALPRMEARYGRFAFVVNGVLWNLPFHLYTFWSVFTDLPMYIIVPFVAMKTRSTTAAIILHYALPLLALVYLIPGVLGRH
jgi:membrane protease YdiL (CAAX protease family)